MSNPFSLIAIKSSSLLHFGQPELLEVQVWMHSLQRITESQQLLTTTGGCIVSLQITHSKQSKMSFLIAFCTAHVLAVSGGSILPQPS